MYLTEESKEDQNIVDRIFDIEKELIDKKIFNYNIKGTIQFASLIPNKMQLKINDHAIIDKSFKSDNSVLSPLPETSPSPSQSTDDNFQN